MNILNTQDKISSALRTNLKEIGFDSDDYLPQFNSIRFFQNDSKKTKNITLQFYNDSLGINSLSGFLSLNDVNDILQRFVDLKVNKEYCTFKNFEQKQVISDEIIKLNAISKEGNIDQFSTAIISHINRIILPFFERYSDINTINEIINKVPESDYPDWIHGQSTLKILIIMRLCSNTKYDEYKTKKEQEYISFVKQNESMWQPYYEKFLSLTRYLESNNF